MSIAVMSAVWKSAEARGAALLILLALADYANENGICWPSVETLSHKARVSERHAHRILTQLERGGVIRIGVREGPKGVNLYRVLAGDMASGGDDISAQGVTFDTPGGLT